MDRQCSSCGGFCKQSGCERENVKPEPEPVAWCIVENGRVHGLVKSKPSVMNAEKWQPLYTAPPQRKPLTDDRISEILNTWDNADGTIASLCRSIEAAHGIKD